VQDIRKLFGAFKQQTIKTKWITAEVDRITALFYFIIIISLFVVATQTQIDFLPKFEHAFANATQTTQTVKDLLPPFEHTFGNATQTVKDLLPPFEHTFGNIKLVDLYVMIFCIVALIGVCIMLVLRIMGLQTKALIVFKYLTALRAIKTHKNEFETTLEDIERYLDDNHWTLAEYWVKRVEQDYSEVFLEEVKKPTKVARKPIRIR
jgi:hypothetical protein